MTGKDRRKKTVSGYFHDWATWMGSVENIKSKLEIERTTSINTDLSERDEEEDVDNIDEDHSENDLWGTWDKILIKWNSGMVSKTNEVKSLVRRGIPGRVGNGILRFFWKKKQSLTEN